MSRSMQVEIYTVNELSEEARETAYDDFYNRDSYPWFDENRETLEKFAQLFDIHISDWSYGDGRNWIDFGFNSKHEDAAEFTGVRLMKYLNNNFYDDLMSKDSCILTGYYLDECILDPIYKFLKNPREYFDITFEELINECLDEWLKTCQDDLDGYYSMENFIEISEANDWEYTEDGEMI